MMTRSEWLEWCKQRARPYIEAGQLTQVVASMSSDFGKHPETEDILHNPLFMAMALIAVQSKEDCREFVEGWQ